MGAAGGSWPPPSAQARGLPGGREKGFLFDPFPGCDGQGLNDGLALGNIVPPVPSCLAGGRG